MNYCPIHQRDYEVACPECMGEAAAEISAEEAANIRFFPEEYIDPAPRPEHAPWLKSLPQFKKFVIPSSRVYGKSWLHDLWKEVDVLDSHRRGLSRSDLWVKYPEFTKAQIRKMTWGVSREQSHAETRRWRSASRRAKIQIIIDEFIRE